MFKLLNKLFRKPTYYILTCDKNSPLIENVIEDLSINQIKIISHLPEDQEAADNMIDNVGRRDHVIPIYLTPDTSIKEKEKAYEWMEDYILKLDKTSISQSTRYRLMETLYILSLMKESLKNDRVSIFIND